MRKGSYYFCVKCNNIEGGTFFSNLPTPIHIRIIRVWLTSALMFQRFSFLSHFYTLPINLYIQVVVAIILYHTKNSSVYTVVNNTKLSLSKCCYVYQLYMELILMEERSFLLLLRTETPRWWQWWCGGG